jgi:hypothetical protein
MWQGAQHATTQVAILGPAPAFDSHDYAAYSPDKERSRTQGYGYCEKDGLFRTKGSADRIVRYDAEDEGPCGYSHSQQKFLQHRTPTI